MAAHADPPHRDRYEHRTAGTWCPVCARKAPLLLDDMRQLARRRGGKCVSRRYVNTRTPLLWECAAGQGVQEGLSASRG